MSPLHEKNEVQFKILYNRIFRRALIVYVVGLVQRSWPAIYKYKS